jgi:tripartite-type tricarboxylate transporter receptor subunit TctC
MEKALDIRITKADAGGVTERIATVVGGHADTVLLGSSQLKSYIDAGELTALACMGTARDPLLPDMPTIIEAGYDFTWPGSPISLFLPPGTDDSLVQLMDSALSKIARDQSFIDEIIKVDGADLVDYRPTTEALAIWEDFRLRMEEAHAAISQ